MERGAPRPGKTARGVIGVALPHPQQRLGLGGPALLGQADAEIDAGRRVVGKMRGEFPQDRLLAHKVAALAIDRGERREDARRGPAVLNGPRAESLGVHPVARPHRSAPAERARRQKCDRAEGQLRARGKCHDDARDEQQRADAGEVDPVLGDFGIERKEI